MPKPKLIFDRIYKQILGGAPADFESRYARAALRVASRDDAGSAL
jgi:hypothetical protein